MSAVAFSPNGRMLASASDDGYARLWDARTRKKLADFPPGPAVGFNDVAFSPDARTLAAAANVGGGGAVVLWDIRNDRQRIRRVRTPVETVAFSEDGRLPRLRC